MQGYFTHRKCKQGLNLKFRMDKYCLFSLTSGFYELACLPRKQTRVFAFYTAIVFTHVPILIIKYIMKKHAPCLKN